MSRIVKWDNVTNRYLELGSIGDAVINEPSYIQPAEITIEGALASHFTVPFSNDNLTAVDLVIDEVYRRMMITRQPKKAKEMLDSINLRIKSLKEGKSSMQIGSDFTTATANGLLWSNTKDYHPATGMGNTLDFMVDSSMTYDEASERGQY